MVKNKIAEGKTFLGIELGSTRIKACLIDDSFLPVASGSYDWENKYENGYWTYSIDEVHKGVKECYADLCRDVEEKYGVKPTKYASIGISALCKSSRSCPMAKPKMAFGSSTSFTKQDWKQKKHCNSKENELYRCVTIF